MRLIIKDEKVVKMSLSRTDYGVFLNAEIDGQNTPILCVQTTGEIRPCYIAIKQRSNLLREAGFPIDDKTTCMDFVKLDARPDPNTYPSCEQIFERR